MARRKRTAAPKRERRPRAEIDRNYFFGDVLIKTGAALGIVLAGIALYTPFSLKDAIGDRMYDYLLVMGIFGFIGLAALIGGYHLRREATHWDFD